MAIRFEKQEIDKQDLAVQIDYLRKDGPLSVARELILARRLLFGIRLRG